MEKGASLYSKPWKKEKINPKEMVVAKAILALLKFFLSISWWLHVIETPEDKRRIVFNKGILMGLKEVTDRGGHIWPNSMVGEILLWKKAQKKDKKKNTSEVINKIIPVFKPFITMNECCPWLEASRWMSRHHAKDTKITLTKTIKIIK